MKKWYSIIIPLLIGWTLDDIIYGPWAHDSGYFLNISAWIATGLKPYLDFKLYYLPAMLTINALLISTGLDRVLLTILIPLLWIIAIAVATEAMIFRWTCDRALSIAIGALYFVFCIENGGNHVTLEHGTVLFSCLALLFASRPQSWVSLMLGGASLALAFLSKQVAAITFFPFILLIWENHPRSMLRRIKWLAAGALVPLIAFLFWLHFDFHSLYSNFYLPFVGYVDHSAQFSLKFLGYEWQRSVFSVTLVLTTFGMILFRTIRAQSILEGLKWLSLGITILVHFLTRGIRNYPHYGLNAWPFIALALGLSLHSLPKRIQWKLAYIGLFGMLFLIHQVYHFKDYANRWAGRSILMDLWNPTAQEIENRTRPDQRIMALGDQDILLFLSRRLPQELRTDGTQDFKFIGNPSILYDPENQLAQKQREQLIQAGYQREFRKDWSSGGHKAGTEFYISPRRE